MHTIYFFDAQLFCGVDRAGKTGIDNGGRSAGLSYNNISHNDSFLSVLFGWAALAPSALYAYLL